MTERIIDEELKLIPYYRNDEASLEAVGFKKIDEEWYEYQSR